MMSLLVVAVVGLFIAGPAHGLVFKNIQCDSNQLQRTECPLDVGIDLNIMDVSIIRQDSSSPCTFGTTFGFTSSTMWVDNGCRAFFNVRACKTVTTQNCASNNFVYNTCKVPGTNFVTQVLVDQQNSNSPCTEFSTYGITEDSIWVNNGCRARFLVCSD